MIHYIDAYPGREINVQGHKYLYFGGTSYLGLQTDEEFQNVFIKNIKKFGIGQKHFWPTWWGVKLLLPYLRDIWRVKL